MIKSHQTLRPPNNRWDTATSQIQQCASNAPNHQSLVSDLQLLAGFGKLRRHLPAKILPINYGVEGKAWKLAARLFVNLAAGSSKMRCRKIERMLLWKEKVVELEPYPVWVRIVNQNLQKSYRFPISQKILLGKDLAA